MNVDASTIAQLVIKSRLSGDTSEKMNFGEAGEKLASEIMVAINAKRKETRKAVLAERA